MSPAIPEIPESAKPKEPGETAHQSNRTILSLIFLTGFLLVPLLSLGTLFATRVISARPVWEQLAGLPPERQHPDLATIQAYLNFYFSPTVLLNLLPADIIMITLIGTFLLTMITIMLLAEAQLTDDPNRVDALVHRADKYLRWIISFVFFLIFLEFSTVVEILRIFAVDDLLSYAILDLVVTVAMSYYVYKVIFKAKRSFARH